jgi:carbonic anhydrase
MTAVTSGQSFDDFPSLSRWLSRARSVRMLGEHPSPDAAARLNTLLQLEHLSTYAVVRKRAAAGELRLHAWYYDIGTSELFEWDDPLGGFQRLTTERIRQIEEEHRQGT